MREVFVSMLATPMETGNGKGYIVAAIIALFILIYLFYSLVKPEKNDL